MRAVPALATLLPAALLALCSILLESGVSATPFSSFSAAVVSYAPSFDASSPNATRSENLRAYGLLVEAASKEGAKVVVFPEFGVAGGEACKSRSALLEAGEPVPPAGTSAFDPAVNPALHAMGAAAAAHGIDVVVNIVERTGDSPPKVYNTEVVLEAGSGAVGASYRKSHVWYHTFDQPEEPELVVYNSSSYAPPIGVFTCFDIVFHSPAVVLRDRGVSHFFYSVAQGALGKATVIPLWSWAHKAVVLSSNLGLGVSRIYVNGKAAPDSRDVPVAGTGGGGLVVASVPY